MTQLERLFYLNRHLLNEMPEYESQATHFSNTYADQRRLLRCLMNVRTPMPLDATFLEIQDAFLSTEVQTKGIVALSDLTPAKLSPHIYLLQGDITTLQVDAIVNAANSALLGCFVPCHGCIDNAIHSVAGLQLRRDCDSIMQVQGHNESTGHAKITMAHNLPCRYVIHTVGPIVGDTLTEQDCTLLKNCYTSCLQLAMEHNLHSIAFCCISTGEFHFPSDKAAEIAVHTVTQFIKATKCNIEVIFNVFKEKDYAIYRDLLGSDCTN